MRTIMVLLGNNCLEYSTLVHLSVIAQFSLISYKQVDRGYYLVKRNASTQSYY